MPRAEGPRARKGGPRKASARSIRDAAAGAAGGTQAAFPDYRARAAQGGPWDEPPAPQRDGGGPDPDTPRTLGDWFEAVIPPDAQVHFIRAGQEFAAGVQTTVDHHLGRGRGADGATNRPTRIEIE